jgi:hypothetical protein
VQLVCNQSRVNGGDEGARFCRTRNFFPTHDLHPNAVAWKKEQFSVSGFSFSFQFQFSVLFYRLKPFRLKQRNVLNSKVILMIPLGMCIAPPQPLTLRLTGRQPTTMAHAACHKLEQSINSKAVRAIRIRIYLPF